MPSLTLEASSMGDDRVFRVWNWTHSRKQSHHQRGFAPFELDPIASLASFNQAISVSTCSISMVTLVSRWSFSAWLMTMQWSPSVATWRSGIFRRNGLSSGSTKLPRSELESGKGGKPRTHSLYPSWKRAVGKSPKIIRFLPPIAQQVCYWAPAN